MCDSRQIEIQLSKSKLILMLLGSFVFVVLGVCFIINPTKFESPIMKSHTIIFIAGLLCIFFFGAVGFFILGKLKDKSPGKPDKLIVRFS
jgi:uncharacterized membrane protein